MRLRGFDILLLLIIFSSKLYSQNTFKGKIFDDSTDSIVSDVELSDINYEFITKTNAEGKYILESDKTNLRIILYKEGYNYKIINISPLNDTIINISPISVDLNEVTILGNDYRFSTTKLNDIVGEVIFAGKKSNKIIMKSSFGNISTNTARHVFNKIGGLNIFQNDDAGLQLNIGGRGLNPGRSANFNLRQNNYDISADVLGYPESYYTPPSEALKEIQVVRGAASLQYGTQFGGLVNFVFNKPNPDKKINILFINTIGSNKLYTNFTSVSGTIKKTSYYSFVNYKKGDGFRNNSEFESINLFANVRHEFSSKLNISFEVTYLTYLAQQAGGLTDDMFLENPYQSNRERNWFEINWFLSSLKLSYELNENDKLSLNFFTLDANRFTVGYRNIRVNQADPLLDRDLIKGFFRNYGFELRYLNSYSLSNRTSFFLVGIKFYRANNSSQQGPGSSGFDADFSFNTDEYPFYPNQSYYNYPNLNAAFFIENILYVNNKLSITPGLRYEYIETKSDGYYRSVYLNLVNEPIYDTTIYSKSVNNRTFPLFGLGISFKTTPSNEFYGNITQNYRSVTFADISIQNPSYIIDPNIKDESGYSFDIGYRGVFKSSLRFDFNYFGLRYNDRIGFIPKKIETLPGFFTIKTQKGNIGDAFITGFESLLDHRVSINCNYQLNSYINYAFTISNYLESGEQNIIGNDVEFVPDHNLKAGINLEHKRFKAGFQLTYLSKQFTDATNSIEPNNSGTLGEIPGYYIMDFSSSINYKQISLSFGVNNILNNIYFARRATGYPGPGIIPSNGRNYYLTLEISLL